MKIEFVANSNAFILERSKSELVGFIICRRSALAMNSLDAADADLRLMWIRHSVPGVDGQ